MTEHFAEVGCYRGRMSGSAGRDLLAIETQADLYCRHWRYQSPKNYAMNPSRFDLLGFVQSNPGWGYRQCSWAQSSVRLSSCGTDRQKAKAGMIAASNPLASKA